MLKGTNPRESGDFALWTITEAAPGDAAELAAIAARAFRETFHHYQTDALQQFLEEEYNAQVFAQDIANPKNRIWLAKADGHIVGYAKLGEYKLPLAPARTPVCELHRLYILKSWHGYKIGAALMKLALQAARDMGCPDMYLGVWSGNINAQQFYARYGFVKVGEYDYPPIGEVVDREWILCKSLV